MSPVKALSAGAALAAGATFAGTVRVATLDPDYRESEAYRRTLFVPAIVLGLGFAN